MFNVGTAINMTGVAVVYSLNKLKLRQRFTWEKVRIERLERIVFLRVSFIRWAFGYCVYLCSHPCKNFFAVLPFLTILLTFFSLLFVLLNIPL